MLIHVNKINHKDNAFSTQAAILVSTDGRGIILSVSVQEGATQ